jgi:hypothetical protein
MSSGFQWGFKGGQTNSRKVKKIKIGPEEKMGIKERRIRREKIRQKQILDAAKKLFFEQGFAATSMNQIAKKVELSKGTLYLYFKNKEELYILNKKLSKALIDKTTWHETWKR